jgi:hypothetical protein
LFVVACSFKRSNRILTKTSTFKRNETKSLHFGFNLKIKSALKTITNKWMQTKHERTLRWQCNHLGQTSWQS